MDRLVRESISCCDVDSVEADGYWMEWKVDELRETEGNIYKSAIISRKVGDDSGLCARCGDIAKSTLR